MKRISSLLVASIFCIALPNASFAQATETEKGLNRMGEGTKDAVTSPGQITKGISEDTEKHGAAGVVTGTAKGTVKGAGQAAKGAANVGVGAAQTIVSPITNQ